jgi:hypothetical protein
MEAWLRANPTLLNRGPLDFVTTLVKRAADELPDKVGKPLTRVSLTRDNEVDWVEVGACPEEAEKDRAPRKRPVPPRKSGRLFLTNSLHGSRDIENLRGNEIYQVWRCRAKEWRKLS